MTILIIENDVRQVVFLEDIVKGLGHQALIARNGIEGLEKARDEQPDLIILDIRMPGMDGFEVCKRIRQDASIGNTAILMLTAMTRPEDRARGFDMGADDCLIKPYGSVELEGKITALLRSRPPFQQSGDIRKVSLTCRPDQRISVKSNGFRIDSRNILTIDPIRYARYSQNAYQPPQNNAYPVGDWRFRTQDAGRQIYQKIFKEHDTILITYHTAKAKVSKTYYLKLCFESFLDFFTVPVEFLFEDIALGDYLVLKHPITRFIMGVAPQRPCLSPTFFNDLWRNRERLKILLIASNTEPPLQHVDDEVLSLKNFLGNCLKAKNIPYKIEYIPTERATFDLVTDKLKECRYHILHYAGHGSYRELSPEQSYLQFWSEENHRGEVKRLKVTNLNGLLGNSNLRFVYLSSCLGAVTAGSAQMLDNDFPGLIYGIAQAGIPSVLGFRWEISDQGAKKLALSFYKYLFEHGDPALALYNARMEIATNNIDDPTWMSPVLIVQE